MLDQILEDSILFDFYGALLTEKQREAFRLYHEDNLSLSEIAEELSISRQGVHEAVKKAETSLHDYEEKLKLAFKFRETGLVLKELSEHVDRLIRTHGSDEGLKAELIYMKESIGRLAD